MWLDECCQEFIGDESFACDPELGREELQARFRLADFGGVRAGGSGLDRYQYAPGLFVVELIHCCGRHVHVDIVQNHRLARGKVDVLLEVF